MIFRGNISVKEVRINHLSLLLEGKNRHMQSHILLLKCFAMSQVVEYPTDRLTTEYRDQEETGGFSDVPRRVLQFKHTLPSLPNRNDKKVWYELWTALALQQVSVRNELESIFHKLTLKGIGSSSHQSERDHGLLSDTAEVAFDQIGLGSVQGAARAWVNSFFGISNSIRQHIDLKRDGVDYGDMSVRTYVLDHPSYVKRNGFPDAESEIPSEASTIILSRIITSMSRQEMQLIFENASRVSTRYGNAPRPIIRVDYPHSLFINHESPVATFHTALRSSEHPAYVHTRLGISVAPLTRDILQQDSTSVSLSEAPQL